MSRYMFHPMAFAGGWLLALSVSGLSTVVTAAAETARAELKDARGVRVGEATLQDISILASSSTAATTRRVRTWGTCRTSRWPTERRRRSRWY
jgi:hypothetical protein